jgi:hypothetical protein
MPSTNFNPAASTNFNPPDPPSLPIDPPLAASAYLQSSNLNIPNATNTIITFDTVETDPSSMFDGVSKFTAPTAGMYCVTGSVATGGLNTSSGANFLTIIINGEAQYGIQSALLSDSGAAPGACVTAMIFMNEGDYAQLNYFQNSGGAGVAYGSDSYSNDGDGYGNSELNLSHFTRLSIAAVG